MEQFNRKTKDEQTLSRQLHLSLFEEEQASRWSPKCQVDILLDYVISKTISRVKVKLLN